MNSLFTPLILKKFIPKSIPSTYKIYKDETESIDIEANCVTEALKKANIPNPAKIIFITNVGYMSFTEEELELIENNEAKESPKEDIKEPVIEEPKALEDTAEEIKEKKEEPSSPADSDNTAPNEEKINQ